MALDQAKFRALRAALDVALAEVAKAHGFKRFDLGRIAVDMAGGFRVQLSGIPEGGLSETERMYNVTREYSRHALPALGDTFTMRGVAYIVAGQATRGRRRIEVARGGKIFLVPVESFENLFPTKKVTS